MVEGINPRTRLLMAGATGIPKWVQVGNDLNISGIGDAAITALSATQIAYIDETNDDLRTYNRSRS